MIHDAKTKPGGFGLTIQQWPRDPHVRRIATSRAFRIPAPSFITPEAMPARAFLNHGVWRAWCPDCPYVAEDVWRGYDVFWCMHCGNAACGGAWRPLIWPEHLAEIEAALDPYPAPAQNWEPWGEAKDLTAEAEAWVAHAGVMIDPEHGLSTNNVGGADDPETYTIPVVAVTNAIITSSDANVDKGDIRYFRQFISANPAGTGLPLVATGTDAGSFAQVAAAGIADNAITTVKILNTAVTEPKLADGAVTAGKIGIGQVTTANLDSGAVTEAKITNGSVTTNKIADIAVTEPKLADGAVTAGKLGNGQVTNAKLDTGAVTETKITNGAVTTNKLGADAVDSTKLADNAVGSEHIQANAVGSSELADGAVDTAAISDGQVTYPKAASSFFYTPVQVSPSGDYALTNAFADITGMTHTTTRTGKFLVTAHVAFTQGGILTTGEQFKVRVQTTGSGTVNSKEAPSARSNTAALSHEIASATWVVSVTSGDVIRLQAVDSQASNLVEADYTWMTVAWISP